MLLPLSTRYAQRVYLFSPNHRNIHLGQHEAVKTEASSQSELDSGVSMALELRQVAETSPKAPGIYLFRTRDGMPLYVGKAKSLRHRLSSYFRPAPDPESRVAHLLTSTRMIETLVTNTEQEALDLENRLIKQIQPRYNVLLRDDKTYPYVKLAEVRPFPQLSVARRMEPDGASYYGPFIPAGLAYQIIKVLRRYFDFPGSSRAPSEPGKSRKAPLVAAAGAIIYQDDVRKVRGLLQGHTEEAIKDVSRRMLLASDEYRFEEANRLWSCIRVLEKMREQANAARIPLQDIDVAGVYGQELRIALELFQFRSGRLVKRHEWVCENRLGMPIDEMLTFMFHRLYRAGSGLPAEIYLPAHLRQRKILERALSNRDIRKIRSVTPSDGSGRSWLKMANRNARIFFEDGVREPRRPNRLSTAA
ncbi:MAG: hypothetical protein EPN47_19755 [Acidobacteria bacterium]|nr:MAG: hypothetical protein EPN47_19755 [Acidobacteriota bacterium]